MGVRVLLDSPSPDGVWNPIGGVLFSAIGDLLCCCVFYSFGCVDD